MRTFRALRRVMCCCTRNSTVPKAPIYGRRHFFLQFQLHKIHSERHFFFIFTHETDSVQSLIDTRFFCTASADDKPKSRKWRKTQTTIKQVWTMFLRIHYLRLSPFHSRINVQPNSVFLFKYNVHLCNGKYVTVLWILLSIN